MTTSNIQYDNKMVTLKNATEINDSYTKVSELNSYTIFAKKIDIISWKRAGCIVVSIATVVGLIVLIGCLIFSSHFRHQILNGYDDNQYFYFENSPKEVQNIGKKVNAVINQNISTNSKPKHSNINQNINKIESSKLNEANKDIADTAITQNISTSSKPKHSDKAESSKLNEDLEYSLNQLIENIKKDFTKMIERRKLELNRKPIIDPNSQLKKTLTRADIIANIIQNDSVKIQQKWKEFFKNSKIDDNWVTYGDGNNNLQTNDRDLIYKKTRELSLFFSNQIGFEGKYDTILLLETYEILEAAMLGFTQAAMGSAPDENAIEEYTSFYVSRYQY